MKSFCKIMFFVLLTSILMMNLSFANVDSLILKTQKAHSEKNYAQAREGYLELEKLTGGNSAVYYNLGLIALENKSLGQARLYFEKAQTLNPRSQMVQKALTKTMQSFQSQKDIVEDKTLSELFFQWNRWLSLSEAQILLLSFLFLFLIYSGLTFLKDKKISWLKYALVSLVCLYLSLGCYFHIDSNFPGTNGVVLKSESPVYLSYISKEEPLLKLEEGRKLEILSKKEGWFQIVLPNQSLAWIESENFGEI